MTPFQALYGFPPTQVAEVVIPARPVHPGAIKEQANSPFKWYKTICTRLSLKSKADKHRTERGIQIGDMVYLKLQPHKQTS